jgi:hypothetical protein
MPDTKITALTALTTADPANDMMPIVDVSDTTMAASGTTKRISINNILACSPTATLASATITGDLTVRTNKLKVDASGVAIGATSASYLLDVRGTDTTVALIAGLTKGIRFVAGASTLKIEGVDNTGAVSYQPLSIGGSALDFSLSGSTAMTLNSTGLGVGVTPSAGRGAIQLSAGVGFPATQVASSDANTLDDYEEGTFTPTIIGSTTAGSATYSTQAGNYTKIGRLVTVQMYIGWTGHTGTGDMSISGLPFTSINTISVASAAIGLSDSISLTAGNILAGYVVPNATEVLFKQFPTGGGGSSNVPVDAAGSVMLTVSYIANA